jgi:secondary thiamine-phosphate synthase enzyme
MSLVHQATLTVETRGPALYGVTQEVGAIVRASGISTGICVVFVQHTSASLVIQENASPAVHRDLLRWLDRLAPQGTNYEHDDEGPDDMPAHLRASITKTSETIPVSSGRLALGVWQGLYLCEHRQAPHRRTIVVTVTGV